MVAALQMQASDVQVMRLERLIRRMAYDDALTYYGWQVEYLHLSTGLPHYKLLRFGLPVWVVDVRHPNRLPAVQRGLAEVLASMQWDASEVTFVECGACTPFDAKKRDLPRLKL